MTLSVGLCTLLMAVSAPEHPPPKPSVELRVYPRITTADIVDGREITATLVMKNIDETLWCPEIDWEWNGAHSVQKPLTCEPFESSDEGERRYVSKISRRRFFGRGVVNIIVRLLKGGKVIRRVEARVPIQ